MSFGRLFCISLALLAACGDEPGEGGTVDVRVDMPEADSAFIDLATPEIVIPAGVEKMYCFHVDYTGEETAMTNLIALQGRFGHHAILLTSTTDREDGYLEDCTDRSMMANYDPLVITEAL